MSSAQIKPIIFIPDESKDGKELKAVYYEHGHYQIDILWYYWPKDGFFPEPDYEPIVFIFSRDRKLKLVSPRRGWNFEPEEASALYDPIEIVFGGIGGRWEDATAGQHHPYFHYKGLDADFEKQKKGKIRWDYQITPIDNPNTIPPVGRIGKNHLSLFVTKGKTSDVDPIDWAKAKLHEL